MRLTTYLNLPAPGRRQCLYVRLEYAFADTCVFAKQSLGTIHCGRSLLPLTGHILPAPLIPKLRGHFAEFLLRKSLEPLRLLASPTCVGLRYGQRRPSSAKLFSAVGVGHPLRGLTAPSASALDSPGGFAYLGASTALRRNPPPAGDSAPASLLRLVTVRRWYGNVDPFPITYAFRPRLRDRLTLS